LGEDWYRFLADCRVVLGCEGGASLLDKDGKLRSIVNSYCDAHPQADFDEVEENCFKGLDGDIRLMTLSPRHFESALTKTCQALVVGDYEGVFKPEVHYIPIASDFSNLEEVVKKIADVKYCEEMAERTYNEVVRSGRFSYETFVRDVLRRVEDLGGNPKAKSSRVKELVAAMFLRISEDYVVPVSRKVYALKALGFKVLNGLGLAEVYRGLRRRLLAWED
jgi:hypothetical protein